MSGGRPVDDKKDAKTPPEKKEPKPLESIQRNIADITDAKRKGKAEFLDVMRGPLGAAAAQPLTTILDEKTGALGRDKLLSDQANLPEKKRQSDEEKKLDTDFKTDKDAVIAVATAQLATLTAAVNMEISKLFNSPPAPAFDEKQWADVFNSRMEQIHESIETQRAAIKDRTGELIARGLGVPPPGAPVAPSVKEALEKRRDEQLKALDALEKHLKDELDTLRDKSIFQAIQSTKFQSHPGVAGAALLAGDVLNANENLTLADHAERLRLSEDLLGRIIRIKEKSWWNDQEIADFAKNGIIKGQYTTSISAARFVNYFLKKDFEITENGIKLNEGWMGNTVENYDLMLELFYAKTGKKEGVLSIEENVSLSMVETFAKAVIARQNIPGKSEPTLKLSDDSIKNLLKQKTLLGYQKNSPEDIAKASLGLQGKLPGKPTPKDYNDLLKAEIERVNGIAAGLASESKKDKKSEEGEPAARARRGS